MKIALIGDYDGAVTAHQAIPLALDIAARELAVGVEPVWIHSSEIELAALRRFDAVWCVPRSPYADGEAVIAAIELARRDDMPFLGTCAGYQHAVLEFARHALGIESAASSEDNPHAPTPVIDALSCGLIDVGAAIDIDPASRLGQIYGCPRAIETYHCNYGVNARYLAAFEGSAMNFSCRDEEGQPRAFELDGHRFFIGTAFQPERRALEEKLPPLVAALVTAAL
jgi:CTP synthase (UTP-ammonia lyase)